MLAPEYVDDEKCPNFTTTKVTRNNTCIIPKYIALTWSTYFVNFTIKYLELHLISLPADGGLTCCCDNVENCCWNGCNHTTGEHADKNCKDGVLNGVIEYNSAYWAWNNFSDTYILLGERVVVMIGKFYTHVSCAIYCKYVG